MKSPVIQTLGVILARGGSVGLPNKHVLPLFGRPVIEYTFDHARSANRLTRNVVTSDSSDILRIAAKNRFATIRRPAHLATSDASVQDVLLHALEETESRGDFRADAIVVLYGNVPVRPTDAINRAVDHLFLTGCDSVRSLTPVGKFHPAWMHKLDDDRMTPLQAGSIHRRQDLETLYSHDGGVVAVSRASLLLGREAPSDPHAFFGRDRRGIVVEQGDTIEIDHRRDLYWAEAVLRDRANGQKAAA